MIAQEELLRARILVVDDNPVNVELLEVLLRGSGYASVSSTTDPLQVAPLHAEHRYDLIILDLHMPVMNGLDVMRALKAVETGAWLPVLVVTADPDKKMAALEAGARDFIGKPFDALEVLTRIRNLLEVRLLHRESTSYGARLEQTVRERTAELQRFRSAMDATADAIFLIDAASMELVDVSDGACRMLGYERDELIGADPAGFGLATHAQMAAQASPKRASGGQPELVETELTGSDMAALPAEVRWQLEVSDGRRMLIAVARDITERRLAQQRLKHLANYDSLTGLPNRVLFYQTLHDTIEMARDKDGRVAVLSIGLDRFKLVNDSLGSMHGDELLRQFSNRLVQCLHARDTLGRLGGDEFALILPTRDQDEAVHVASEVREALRWPFDIDGQQLQLTASIGIAMYPDDATDPQTLIKYADTAMGRAKAAGRDGYRFFTAGMNVQVLARLDLEVALRRALENGEFELYYQPKMNVNTGRITGVEALLRWHRPGYGMVFPAEFVPILEETGLIVKVGAWIIDAACRQVAAWLASGIGEVRVAVNVSSRQFVEGDLEEEVGTALRRHGVDAALLELELTESALMANAEHTSEVLTRLRDLGIRISIDDFGTGYSSLAYLKRFPIDKLKIDIAFVRDITTNPDDAAIALAIISMAHSMHMQVIAEGVESRAQLMYLRRHRCDQVQGFHVSRALTARQLGEMVAANRLAPDDHAANDTEHPTLLIVDDDINALAALHRLFRRDNYKILTAVSPAEGFDLLAQHQVQVIVCDQRMPFMSGTEFLSRVKEMYPDTVRIILAGETGLQAVLDSINSGAIYRFYTKPWDDTQLRDNIRLAFHHYWRVNGARDDPRRSRVITQDEEAEGLRVSRR
ncbi:EAL domain-containing protein [Massilia sp. GCM10020059]|uniref:EAL domain-containing protein n=1 Tax=Massilia agrisoli TaxID=2892444 RepID=A0ABS8IX54_9BURK|nr:EAL domain-containing protein [Massilia agrisoli]MCC6073194.1 EAL domain-containing protein [Massilia agrisoli]